MRLIKRRTQISYKPVTDEQWYQAYIKYLECNPLRAVRPTMYDRMINSLEDFKILAANIWHPIAEVDKEIETEEKFIERVTKLEAKDQYTDLQFIANQYGEIVSCVLF